ncbi:FHA domain-containing protein [Povalibacter sp.]|uniref:FHA domain-containing protein n=1 Tax=Povalibacter sp. TaxID=1962978 RepID=UPI002F42E64B
MSTHPHSEDLDRTDELPQLDVVAYEASNSQEATDPLSTTDTWLVESFGEPETETIVRSSQAGFPAPGGVDLSINVERLRQRIDTLEAELAAARRAQRETEEAATRIPNTERNELHARVAALEAQGEYLRQQHEISEALTQRLQQQLREQVETHKTQLARTDETREAERLAAEQQRIALEQQLERSMANFTSTADEYARMREALEETRELASSRARQIDELQRVVISEHGKAHALGRNLAAKLADYDIMSSMVSQRNASIAALERSREELNEQLQKAFADAHRLSALRDAANHRAASSDRLAAEIAARDEQLTQLGLELEALRHQAQQSQLTHQALEENLRDAAARAAADQERYDELQSQMRQLESALNALAQERDGLLAERRTLDERLHEAASGSAADQDRQDRLLAQIRELESTVASLTQERDGLLGLRQSLESNLTEATSRSAADQERYSSLLTQIADLESTLLSVSKERDRLAGTAQELAARTAELAQVATELADVKRDAVAVWSELEAQSSVANARLQELHVAHTSIEELQRSNEDLRRKIERLHAVSNDDTQLLNERNVELARMRTEVQELGSMLQGLESSLRARDTLIDTLRAEIRTAQDERGIMSEQLSKARGRVKTMTQQLFNRDNRIATLKADLAVHIEALAAIRQDVDGMALNPEADAADALPIERVLEPVNHEGETLLLNRRVMTIGRTNDNDIFIPSKMISRHHARLLVGPNAVIVEDAGSTNGCYVNDQLVKQHVLHEGDILAIGDLKFRLSARPVAPSGGEVISFPPGGRRED